MVLHDEPGVSIYYPVAVREGSILAQGGPMQVMTEAMVRSVGLECRIVPDPVVGTPMCTCGSQGEG